MQRPKNDTQLPEWIEKSTHLMALVFDQEGRVMRFNNSCKDNYSLLESPELKRVLVFSPNSRELRLDIIAHLSPENSQELSFWMESTDACLSLGRGWEVSPLTDRSEDKFIAIKALTQVQTELDNEASSVQLPVQKMKGFLFDYTLAPDGETSFSIISFGAGSILKRKNNQVDLPELLNWIHPMDIEGMKESFFESGVSLKPWEYTFRYFLSSTDLQWAQGFAYPRKKRDGGVHWHGFIYDVTERVEFESRLIKQQKELEEIAFLQAHEFRRPVANMLGLFDLVEMELRKDKPCFDQFESLLGLMKISVKEADEVIAKIVQRTAQSTGLERPI
ncbi:hypothetical protein [Reichenbachiella ulvae]|uniref:PAS fold-containing protein n=1 Tax=Reichenbachiella ulvae TaxID=2980104 RepID=A0ABT3CRS1_9BACT|nr:hypothetical protein [Reichenbachiella ulvae]MCV9386388.1 hypothetical protein [Reichenbachiella ulvae]